MFAVVEIAGKQYKIQEKQKLLVDLLDSNEGDTLSVDKVLLYVPDAEAEAVIGMPYIDGAMAELKVLGLTKGEKIRVFKMKAKKRYAKTRGHRQKYTEVEVVKIMAKGGVKKTVEKAEMEVKKPVKTEKISEEKKTVKKTLAKKKTEKSEEDQMSLL